MAIGKVMGANRIINGMLTPSCVLLRMWLKVHQWFNYISHGLMGNSALFKVIVAVVDALNAF
jgi:hypothetical protein